MSTAYDPSPFAVSATELEQLIVKADGKDVLDAAGPCPRCTHYVHFRIHRREFGAQGEETGSGDVTLNCNCAHTHEHGKAGCGAWFNVVFHESAGWHLEPGSLDISLYEQQGATDRDKLAVGELDRARSAAASWKTGLAALFALIPTLVVVKGTDTVDKLAHTDRIIVGGLIAFGAALAVTATLLALRAAYGPLRRSKLFPLYLHRKAGGASEVKTTIVILNVTRLLTVVSLSALAAAIGYAWAAPTVIPANFSVTITGNGTYCGTFKGADGHSVQLMLSDQRTVSVPLGRIATTSFVSSC